MKLFFRACLAVWFVATLTYATAVLSTIALYTEVLNRLGYFGVVFVELVGGEIAAWLLWLTHLPAPMTLFLGDEPSTLVDFALQRYGAYPSSGYVLLLTGCVGVGLGATGLLKIQENRNWSWIFIGLSLLVYFLTFVEATTGVCTTNWLDFGAAPVSCQSGMLAAVPPFIASTVLLTTAIVIYRYWLPTEHQHPHEAPPFDG